jgi:GNAT superfamily N-acetyltransferase
MDIHYRAVKAQGLRFAVLHDGKEVGRAYLYMMHNDLHEAPFGLLEDVFIDEGCRGQGIGAALVRKVIKAAKAERCYKLIATSRTSRPKVHELYKRLGFEQQGIEFRMDL